MKNWLKGLGSGSLSRPLEIDELIVLERYDEAEKLLRQKVESDPQDLHARVKLAEVFTQLRRYTKAVGEYETAAREYAADGFHDKGIALLSKALRLAPTDDRLHGLMRELREGKTREHQRDAAMDAIRKRKAGDTGFLSTVEFERMWTNLAGSRLLEDLPTQQLKRLFGVMEVTKLQPDDVLVEKGSDRAELYLIASGSVDAVIEKQGTTATVRRFVAGDIIGEGALLEHLTWPATYRAGSPSTVLRLTRAGLESALVGNSDPRELLQILREQHHDRDITSSLELLEP